MLTVQHVIDIILEARMHALQYVPGATLMQAGPIICIHYETPLYWETDAFLVSEAVDPDTVLATVQAYRPGPHLLAIYTSAPEQLCARWAIRGYKTVAAEPTEAVMRLPLTQVPQSGWPYPVQVVQTTADVACYNAEPDGERMAPEQLHDPLVRHYYIALDGRVVCQGQAFTSSGRAVYVGGMFTQEAYRRRGLATALMQRIHTDAATTGIADSILVALPMGVPLYQRLGYVPVLYVQKFVPNDWRAEASI